MTKLDWDKAFRSYESGIDRGVLYFGEEAIPWDGLVSVTEDSGVSELTPMYFEGLLSNYQEQVSDFSATVSAFIYPYILDDVILAMTDTRTLVSTHQDSDMPFGFSYRTTGGLGYKIHLVYNVTAVIETINRKTIDDTLTMEPFEFKFYTTPVDIPYARPSAHIILDTEVADPDVVFRIEEILYGTANFNPRLPSVSELMILVNGTSSQ